MTARAAPAKNKHFPARCFISHNRSMHFLRIRVGPEPGSCLSVSCCAALRKRRDTVGAANGRSAWRRVFSGCIFFAFVHSVLCHDPHEFELHEFWQTSRRSSKFESGPFCVIEYYSSAGFTKP